MESAVSRLQGLRVHDNPSHQAVPQGAPSPKQSKQLLPVEAKLSSLFTKSLHTDSSKDAAGAQDKHKQAQALRLQHDELVQKQAQLVFHLPGVVSAEAGQQRSPQ